jgi:hypothetical protein
VISATRQTTVVLNEMAREDQDDDLLRSRSEPEQDLDLVSTDRDQRSR